MEIWDAIVIGGGPAGSIAGLSLARQGRRVIVLEKSSFPRFHIGESLLPATFDRLKELGLEPALRSVPHVPKFGAEFAMGNGGNPVEIDFSEGFCKGSETINIERSVFDATLMQEARRAGAEVREGVAVKEILSLADGDVRVFTDAGEIRGRYLLDASGQGTVVARHLKTRKAADEPQLRKVAYGSHFVGVWRQPGRKAGYPLIVMMEEGWFWIIPLNENRTSVGMVMDADIAQRIIRDQGVPPTSMLAWGIARCPVVRKRMEKAIGPETNQVWADFTYTCRPYAGAGYFLVGDAAAFMDPIFSTGVCVAVNAAVAAAGQVDAILAGRTSAERAREIYISQIERCTGVLFHLIRQYYDHSFRELFLMGKGPLQLHRAMIGVLAGNVFPSPPFKSRWRLKAFDYLVKFNRKRQIAPRRRRFSVIKCASANGTAAIGNPDQNRLGASVLSTIPLT